MAVAAAPLRGAGRPSGGHGRPSLSVLPLLLARAPVGSRKEFAKSVPDL